METTSNRRGEVKQLAVELILWLTKNSPGSHVTEMALKHLGYVREDKDEGRHTDSSRLAEGESSKSKRE